LFGSDINERKENEDKVINSSEISSITFSVFCEIWYYEKDIVMYFRKLILIFSFSPKLDEGRRILKGL